MNKDSDAIQHPLGMTGPAIDLFPLGFVWNESIRGAPMFEPLRLNADAFLIAQGDRGTASPDREQLIKTHRVSDPDNVTGGIVVEPQGHVKIHLLIWSEAIHSAPIQQFRGTSILRVSGRGRW